VSTGDASNDTGQGAPTATPGWPPGWYVDPSGDQRYWDGKAWGPYAPPTNQRTSHSAAVLAHVGGIAGGFIVPLVVYLVTDRDDRFTRHHAATALNWQLTYLCASFLAVIVAVPVMIATVASTSTTTRGSSAPPAAFGGFFALWGLMFILGIANLVLSIIGMIKASKGEWWRYPVRIRFLKEDAPA
jgi:uncharacterized Tic20 family protein